MVTAASPCAHRVHVGSVATPGKRRLRHPPPEVVEVRYVPLPVAADGKPLTRQQERAERALKTLFALADRLSPVTA